MWWILLFACGRGAGRAHDLPITTHAGSGWAVGVPEGSQVTVTPELIRVDSADGWAWFDIRWTDEPATDATALSWGRTTCSPPVWDTAWTTESRWTAGGFCVINNRRYWMIHLLEPRDGRTLHTAFLASARHYAYEDAWVLATRTALGFTPGTVPLPAPEPDSVRAAARKAALQPPGPIPVPGGGLLSTRILPELGTVWAGRDAAPPLGPFATP